MSMALHLKLRVLSRPINAVIAPIQTCVGSAYVQSKITGKQKKS